MNDKNQKPTGNFQEGTATHSGWSHFYILFSKYRDECIKVGQIVLGSSGDTAIKYLQPYSSALYSMAQQIFSFYNTDLENKITDEWLGLQDEVNEIIYLATDKDFRNQLENESSDLIPKELKKKLLLFFNKLDRLAAEAGLLVGKEDKGMSEPKKGLVGFRK